MSDLTGFEHSHPTLFKELCKRELERSFYDEICEFIDWNNTFKNISVNLVNKFYCDLYCDWVEKITFSELLSPKYYNYRTDEIYFEIKLSDEQLEEIELYCLGEKKDLFQSHLRKYYTSSDGFVSYIPNDISEFKQDYRQFKSKEDKNYNLYLGILFEFMFTQLSREENVTPYQVESLNETLVFLNEFNEEEIAKKLVTEYDESLILV